MKNKLMKIFSVLLVCLSLMSVNVFAGTWVNNSSSGDAFYKNNNGNVVYGWFKDDEYSQWHYASKWAGVHKDWFYDRDYNTYYHFNGMGVIDSQTPYLEQTDESIHTGWIKIDEKCKDSVVFFCQKSINGSIWNLYYPSSASQADFLNTNINYVYAYNTYTYELQKIDVKTGTKTTIN